MLKDNIDGPEEREGERELHAGELCAWVFFSVSLLCAKNLTSGSLSKFAVAFFFVTALSLATCKISAKKLFLNPGICTVYI